MAVYTHLGADALADLIAHYDVGELLSAKGIAEGISNSNWLIETTGAGGQGARFILTMYERRIETADLPFFLGLLDHLSAKCCAVPRTIHDRAGNAFRMVGDKAVALIEFLPGISVDCPTAEQAHAVGASLAAMHVAALDFPMCRANALSPAASLAALHHAGPQALAMIDRDLPALLPVAKGIASAWPVGLPGSVCHADLFPDNVLMLGNQVSGMIDFYFACNETMAYDLAVTHAAWSFTRDGSTHLAEIGRAIIAGYEAVRPLGVDERAAMPVLAQGACLRFVASRAEDWLDTPADAIVTRKDPMDFARRLSFYAKAGRAPFATGA